MKPHEKYSIGFIKSVSQLSHVIKYHGCLDYHSLHFTLLFIYLAVPILFRTYITVNIKNDNLRSTFLTLETRVERIGVSIHKYNRPAGTINLKGRPFSRNAKMIYAHVQCE